MRYGAAGLLDDSESSVVRRFARYTRLRETESHGAQRFLRVSKLARQNQQATRMLDRVPDKQTRAAVLVGLHTYRGQMCVILTVRARGIAHSGEVSLPGGKQDPEDNKNDIVTALREADEEIGLKGEHVQVLGCLSPIVSRNLVLVTPVVGLVSPMAIQTLVASEGEVGRIFHCPLHMFVGLQGVSHRLQWNGLEFSVPEWRVALSDAAPGVTARIWGLSAKILVRVAEISLHLTAKALPPIATTSSSNSSPIARIRTNLLTKIRGLVALSQNTHKVHRFEPMTPPPLPPGCCFWLFQAEFVEHLEWLVDQMAVAKARRREAQAKAKL